MKGNTLWRTVGLCLGLAVAAHAGFAQPIPKDDVAIDGEDGVKGVIGVGMAFDDNNRPATIAFLYEDINAELLGPGDVIREYRGHRVSTGAELYQLIMDLPDVAPGDKVDLVLVKPTGQTVRVAAVAAVFAEKVTESTLEDRACEEKKGVCLCSQDQQGSTCVRRIHSVLGPDGKTMSTSSSCDDGANICPVPVPPKPAKKGK